MRKRFCPGFSPASPLPLTRKSCAAVAAPKGFRCVMGSLPLPLPLPLPLLTAYVAGACPQPRAPLNPLQNRPQTPATAPEATAPPQRSRRPATSPHAQRQPRTSVSSRRLRSILPYFIGYLCSKSLAPCREARRAFHFSSCSLCVGKWGVARRVRRCGTMGT